MHPTWQVHAEESAALCKRRGRLKGCSLDSLTWQGACAHVCRALEIPEFPPVGGQIAHHVNYGLMIMLEKVLKNACHCLADLLVKVSVPLYSPGSRN